MGDRSIYKTRDDAAAAGSPRYYTGQLCMRGHDSERYTSSAGCVDCVSRKYVRVEQAGRARNRAAILLAFKELPPPADHVRRVGVYMQTLLTLGEVKRAWSERLPLIATGHAIPTLDALRADGISDRQLIALGYARLVGELTATEKCGDIPLSDFRLKGWSDVQLLAQGYAIEVSRHNEPT